LNGPGSLYEVINDRGVISGALVRNSAVVNVFSGGETQNVRIASGGLEIVSGGMAVSALVSSGGVLRISSGGLASGTHVRHGGTETIFANGVATGTVLAGAEFDYGTTSATVVRSGGTEVVHGTASGTVISSGGQLDVASGAAVATTISGGGKLTVASGGALLGGLTIHGGTAVISGTMAAGQTVSFNGVAGTLELDNLAGFHAKISGMSTPSQKVDLGGFAFSAGETVTWTQSGTSGTLKVVDGAKSASLTLIGAYATGDFTLATDGHSGTFVSDPPAKPAAAPAAIRFVEAVAAFSQGRDGSGFAAVHAGGTALTNASALVGAAMSGR
jgi:autotransporter passenger strand-loop-strand repeat protein